MPVDVATARGRAPSPPAPVPASPALLEAGRNCWRVERADRLGLIVDAADYFLHLRAVLRTAKRQILMIGWDFDFEIEMLPGQADANGLAPDGLPNAVGPFLREIVERTPGMRLFMLKWNGAVLLAPGAILPSILMDLTTGERVNFALDGHHPFGACHHQKIVVVDDALAFCGGIDVTDERWDTPDHAPDDPRRMLKGGAAYPPWHDATAAITGPAASALGELARTRWCRATGDTLEDPDEPGDVAWPDDLPITVEGVDLGIARTEPPYDGAPLVNEIEQLYLDGVFAARRTIYLESQYFSTESVCAALERRLREPGGPEVIVMNPQAARVGLEDSAMHPLRGRMIERLRAADAGNRFRIWYPANSAGEPIYVHAKVMLIDDRVLRLGSSNLNDRSMGFDTECDVAFEGHDDRSRAAIAAFRDRLVAEHLGVTPERVRREVAARRSLIEAIEVLNPRRGRGLRAIRPKPEGLLDRYLADTRLLDPRFRPGEPNVAGRGIRPRHLVLGAAMLGAGIGLAVWLARRGPARR